MKLWSSIKFDSLILPILFVFLYDLPIASGSISGPKIAHPAICTGASGDLYWRIRRSVLAHPAICTGASGDLYWHIQWSVLVGYAGRSISTHWMHILEFLVITGVAAANYSDCRKKKNIGNIIESSLINDWSFIFYWTFPLNGFSPTQAELVGVCQLRHALYHK